MDRKTLIAILFFGSLWGFVEVALGKYLSINSVPDKSIYLSIFAAFILASARVFLKKPYTFTLIASVALIFKYLEYTFVGCFICHLMGIFLVGVSFDLIAYMLAKKKDSLLNNSILAFGGQILGFALFAVIITYIVQYDYWDTARMLDHIFVKGMITAGISIPVYNLGYYFTKNFNAIMDKTVSLKPVMANTLVLATTAAFWIVGKLV